MISGKAVISYSGYKYIYDTHYTMEMLPPFVLETISTRKIHFNNTKSLFKICAGICNIELGKCEEKHS